MDRAGAHPDGPGVHRRRRPRDHGQVAAGDDGSTDGVTDGQQHVDFPASARTRSAAAAPACTRIGARRSPARSSGTTRRTTARPAAGSAPCSRCPAIRPSQSARQRRHRQDRAAASRTSAATPTRTPATRSRRRLRQVDRRHERRGTAVGGADRAAEPVARSARRLRPPRLYALLGTDAFRDITSGSNGAYSAGPGWDACTGLGSPDGAALAQGLGSGG